MGYSVINTQINVTRPYIW